MNIDGISLHFLANELNTALKQGRIDKISQPNKQTLVFSIRQYGETKSLCLSINPQLPAIYLLSSQLENPLEPPTFCMLLRKHLESGRIALIHQYELERIIIIDVDIIASGGKIVTKRIYIELMGKYSNIILTQDDIIIDSLRRVGTNSSRVRTILPNNKYFLPPSQHKLNLLTNDTDVIISHMLVDKNEQLSKSLLNICLGFGPVTAKETSFLAGLSSDIVIQELDESDFLSLKNVLNEVRQSLLRNIPFPTLTFSKEKKVSALTAFPLYHLNTSKKISYSTMSELIEKAISFTCNYVPPDKERFTRLIKNELIKAKNKLSILKKEAMLADNAEEYKIKGDNLITYQYSFTNHKDDEIVVTNIYSDFGESITIQLNKLLTLSQNSQSYYNKYSKLRRAQILLKEQLLECNENIAYLESIDESLKSSVSLSELNDIHTELVKVGILKEKIIKKPKERNSLPFEFTSPNSLPILVGKNNTQNDILTFKTASAQDLWFHTKNIPGSHVILRTLGTTPTDEDILYAAKIAASFSKASLSSNVPVDYTLCRFVKKPSGSKPGFVIFSNQKTLYVNPIDSNILKGPILS